MTTKVQDRLVWKATPVAKLRLADENPRRIAPARLEQLTRSLAADPEMLQARPLIALPDGRVICGNMRLRAALELGWEKVPTVTVDLDEERARLWMLRDNQGYGEWDDVSLSEMLRELEAAGTDLDLTGFAPSDLDRLLASLEPVGALGDPDEVPDVPDEPESRPGEVYELGPHRLMCGDGADPGCLAELMAGETADLIVTDPPYGVDYQGGAQAFSASQGKRKVRRLEGDKTAELYAASLPHLHALLRQDGALYLWFSDSRSREVMQAVADAGFQQRAVIVWAKDVPTGSLIAHYIPRHEPMIYASKSGEKLRWFGPTNETTIWEHPKPRVNELHPTQKPVALFERAILNSSERRDLVLDPFGGSGTTLIAAEQTGRRARLMEIDPRYCDVIRKRYEDFRGGA